MKLHPSFATSFIVTSLMTTSFISLTVLLGACASSSNQSDSADPTPPVVTRSPMQESIPSPQPSATPDHAAPMQGGQVVETGAYHLELVVLPEASGTHLDLFLQTGDTHAAVEGATVTGQVQLPDGSQQAVDFEYDDAGKHYATLLPETAPGEYKVVVLTTINGKKVNGRFNFTR